MSEAVAQEVTGEVAEEQSQQEVYSPFSGEYVQENLRDGKLFGRFESIDDLAKSYRELEVVHTNKMRDFSDTQKAIEAEKIRAEQEATIAETRNSMITSMIPEYMNNGMQLNDEQLAQLVETGLDERDVKIYAMELKEKINIAHDTVGGKEEYTNMMQWAGENLSDAQKAAFDGDVTGNMSEFAIQGLYARYRQATGQAETPPTKISGNTAVNTVAKGYESTKELLAEKRYLNSMAGKFDSERRAKHENRMKNTPDSVVFGR